jgi:peptidoglycan/LPS O-acetylase OafA/YrhL
MPALDGVRGLAILMVLAVHFIGDTRADTGFEKILVTVTRYGAMGVDLFFVLSGFLITGILYDSRTKPAYFRNFYMRRVLRIFPLYYGVLLLGLIIVPRFVSIPDLDEAVKHQGWLWAYSANIFVSIRGRFEALPIFSHFWSLAVEEHFYFVWPFVVYLSEGSRLKVIALLVACSALLLRIGMVLANVNELAVYALTPARLDAISLGSLLAVMARDKGGVARLTRLAPWGLLWSCLFIVASYGLTRVFPNARAVLHQVRQSAFAGCFCAILVFSLTGPITIQRIFQSSFMRFFGKYSYGLYVFHMLFGYFLLRYETEDIVAKWVGSHTVAVMLQALIATGFAVLISLISYHAFEKHFLKLKAKF